VYVFIYVYVYMCIFIDVYTCTYIYLLIYKVRKFKMDCGEYAVEAAAQRTAVAVREEEVYKHIWSDIDVYVCLCIYML
jgi:hypothetical protein